jgi:polyisoprenoid-binding protein YceI
MKKLKKGAILFAMALGMVACSSSPEGEKVTAGDKQEVKEVKAAAKTITVNAATSLVTWVGTKPAGEHKGELKVKSGSLQLLDGNLVGGSFVLDMASINVTDLEGEEKGKLEGHLKMGDFFEVEKFPEGKFEIVNIAPLAGQENATHTIGGNLTLRDSTKFVELPAKITIAEGKLTAVTPQFTIDRTKWGIVYKSSKLGEAAINDNMGIAIKLEAQ